MTDEFRDHRFHAKFTFVANQLQVKFPPTNLAPDGKPQGLFDLDEPTQADVLDVAYYFQGWAALAHEGLITEKQLAYMMHIRLVSIWRALAPYVANDRAKRPEMGNFLTSLQEYGELLDTPEMRRHYPQAAA